MHCTTRRVRCSARVARGAAAGDCTVQDGPKQRVSVGNLLGQDGRWLTGGHINGLLETGRSSGRPALLCVRSTTGSRPDGSYQHRYKFWHPISTGLFGCRVTTRSVLVSVYRRRAWHAQGAETPDRHRQRPSRSFHSGCPRRSVEDVAERCALL